MKKWYIVFFFFFPLLNTPVSSFLTREYYIEVYKFKISTRKNKYSNTDVRAFSYLSYKSRVSRKFKFKMTRVSINKLNATIFRKWQIYHEIYYVIRFKTNLLSFIFFDFLYTSNLSTEKKKKSNYIYLVISFLEIIPI